MSAVTAQSDVSTGSGLAPVPGAGSAWRQPPSVLVLARDDELNIADCLRSVSFSDDIVVLDAGSRDRTAEMARSFPTVRVEQRQPADDAPLIGQALSEVSFRHPWVYVCNADERVPADLREEMLDAVNNRAGSHAAYRVRHHLFFRGKRLRFSADAPAWQVRLVRPECVRYEPGHPNPAVNGGTGTLSARFHHHAFHAGLKRWFLLQNTRSDRASQEVLRSPAPRRRTPRRFAFLTEFRGFWRFFVRFVLRLGFLDGVRGFHSCAMITMYEYWTDMKIDEHDLEWRQETQHVVERLLAEPGAVRA